MKINTKITILLALILLLVSCNDKVQKVEKPKYLDELVKIEFTSNEVLSNESIKLTHSKSKDSDMVIRYTVDGSPISGKSKVYSSEIKVDKKMNLKTALYKKDIRVTRISKASFHPVELVVADLTELKDKIEEEKLKGESFKTADLNFIGVRNVESLSELFKDTDFNGDVSLWDTGKVKDMSYLFSGTPFNGDISEWNVSNVENMSYMFYKALNFNRSLYHWDVSSVKNMQCMFSNAKKFDQNIRKWNVKNVINMAGMFSAAINFNHPLNDWDVSFVRDMTAMFSGGTYDFENNSYSVTSGEHSSFNQNLINWKVIRVAKMDYMFADNNKFDNNLKSWQPKVTELPPNMFKNSLMINYYYHPAWYEKIALTNYDELKQQVDLALEGMDKNTTVDLNYLNTEKITSMESLFKNSKCNVDISEWNVSKVENMYQMFFNAENFTGDISKWDVSKVKDARYMFSGATSFNQLLDKWKLDSVISTEGMFGSLSKDKPMIYNQDLSSWKDHIGKLTNTKRMFLNNIKFNKSLESWNVSKIGDMDQMFKGATDFNQKLTSWTTKVGVKHKDIFKDSAMVDGNKPTFN